MKSIREQIIGRLTNHRQLTSAEVAELDTFAVALDLNENDPFWGQIGWVWEVTPRKEWLELSHQALAAEIHHDLKSLITGIENSIGGAHTAMLDEIKKMIESLALSVSMRHNVPAQYQPLDKNTIEAAIAAALDGEKWLVSASEMMNIIKEAAREIVSWSVAVVAAIVLGVSLFVGYSFGQHVQSASDDVSLRSAQKQIAYLTAALPKSASRR